MTECQTNVILKKVGRIEPGTVTGYGQTILGIYMNSIDDHGQVGIVQNFDDEPIWVANIGIRFAEGLYPEEAVRKLLGELKIPYKEINFE